MAGAAFGGSSVTFVAGAVLGEVQVLLFVAGAARGECLNVRLGAKCCIFQEKMLVASPKSNFGCDALCVSLFVAGAVLGDVQVSLFVAGAALGECLNVRLGTKRRIFQ